MLLSGLRTRHAGHCWRSRDKLVSDIHCGPLHMDEQRQDDQLEPTYYSSVLIQDVALKTNEKQWMIEKGGGTGSGLSMLMAWRDDDFQDLFKMSCSIFVSFPFIIFFKCFVKVQVVQPYCSTDRASAWNNFYCILLVIKFPYIFISSPWAL